MPLFLIERNFAERLNLDSSVTDAISKVNDEIGVKWLVSFLSADKKETYCLYEAENADELQAAAKRLEIPSDVIVEVSEVRP